MPRWVDEVGVRLRHLPVPSKLSGVESDAHSTPPVIKSVYFLLYRVTLVGAEMASLSAGRASRALVRMATALKVTLPIAASSLVKV